MPGSFLDDDRELTSANLVRLLVGKGRHHDSDEGGVADLPLTRHLAEIDADGGRLPVEHARQVVTAVLVLAGRIPGERRFRRRMRPLPETPRRALRSEKPAYETSSGIHGPANATPSPVTCGLSDIPNAHARAAPARSHPPPREAERHLGPATEPPAPRSSVRSQRTPTETASASPPPASDARVCRRERSAQSSSFRRQCMQTPRVPRRPPRG